MCNKNLVVVSHLIFPESALRDESLLSNEEPLTPNSPYKKCKLWVEQKYDAWPKNKRGFDQLTPFECFAHALRMGWLDF